MALAAIAPWIAAAGARAQGESAKPGPRSTAINAVVTIPPLASFVRPLLPAGSTVRVLIPPGRNEHGYEFTPADLAAVVSADVLVYVGLGLEPRVEKELASRPRAGREAIGFADAAGIVAAGDAKDDHAGHDHADHEHGPDCDHAVDVHLWLDPALVEKLIPRVREGVERVLARRGVTDAALAERERALLERVRALDERCRVILRPAAGAAIVTHHNAFSRFADRYGLRVVASVRELEDTEPTPGEVAKVVSKIREHKARAIFIEPNFNPAVPRRIAKAAGVKLGVIDPVGGEDWFATMEKNARELARLLVPDRSPPSD